MSSTVHSESEPKSSSSESGRGIRQRNASQFLGKKFADASRLVIASNAWAKTIPTKNCDILMTFPSKTTDDTLMWVLSRLRSRSPKISVHVRHHGNTGVYGFYMTASYENLLREAEELAIKKPLKDEFGGGMQDFTFDEKDFYLAVEDESAFFTSEERQFILLNMLNNLRAEEGERLGKIKFIEGQAIVPLLESKHIISQVLPLHNNNDLTELRKTWVQAFFRFQPLEKVCEYFGVKIAMYFAYLGHYTTALLIPAFIGTLMWCFQGRDQMLDDLCFVGFAVFNVVWATLYLENWKRQSAELAFQWGTLDKKDELLEDPRPLFKGYLIQSSVTGRQEPYYPAWKRNLFRYFVSIPVICTCLCVVFIVMLIIFQIQEWINSLVKEEHLPKFVKFLPKILLAVSIGILDDIYKKIARWLNDKENYRMEETYENHLIIKLVLFQFVNSFLSLFYIAFYLRDMGRLKEQLAALLITKQVIGNVKEALVPWIVWKMKLLKTGYKINKKVTESNKKEDISTPDEVNEEDIVMQPGLSLDTTSDLGLEVTSELRVKASNTGLTQAEVESAMKEYEDTFEDYLEMVIQFGYVTLFSPAFPMAAMCALLNNILEIRSDAFKLCVTFQRPFGQRVESIGTWQDALELLSVIAVIVNCCLVGVFGHTQRLAPDLTDSSVFIIIVVLEHVILFLKFGVAYAIPDIPEGVATQMARLEFLRREAFKKLENKAQSSVPPNSPTKPVENTTDRQRADNSTQDHFSRKPASNSGFSQGRPGILRSIDSASSRADVSRRREISGNGPPSRAGNSQKELSGNSPPRAVNSRLKDDEFTSAVHYLKSSSNSIPNPAYRPCRSTVAQTTLRKNSSSPHSVSRSMVDQSSVKKTITTPSVQESATLSPTTTTI